MKRYSLTFPSVAGNVVFGYSDEGVLVLFRNEGEMTPLQKAWFADFLPARQDQLQDFATKLKAKLEEMPEDLTFEAFWVKYGKKINKKRCEPMWAKMPDTQRIKALRAIVPYKAFLLRTGYRSQVDPENYLKNEYYETDWNREK